MGQNQNGVGPRYVFDMIYLSSGDTILNSNQNILGQAADVYVMCLRTEMPHE